MEESISMFDTFCKQKWQELIDFARQNLAFSKSNLIDCFYATSWSRAVSVLTVCWEKRSAASVSTSKQY